MRIITEADVARVLTYETLIPAMERALAALSAGTVIQPVRTMLTVEEGKRYLGVMPAVTDYAMGAKLVSIYPGNAGTDAPTHTAVILLLRPDTGEPLAALEGRLITEMRTAALSAAVTRKLAPTGADILAILGSGAQATAHLEALRQDHAYAEVRVWSPTPEHARHFADEHDVVLTTNAGAAVRGADVVVTAANTETPLLKGAWLKPGAHVNSVGAPRPTWRELDDAAMANLLVVDSREAALKEAGDVILSGATIFAEAGEIFSGARVADRNATTIFKSVGLAVEDIAAARIVYDAIVAGG